MSDHSKVLELLQVKEQAPLPIDPDKSALIVVDVQRYFAQPGYQLEEILNKLVPGLMDGYLARVEATVLPNIRRLQDAFRARGRPVIFLTVGCQMGDGSDLPEWLKGFDQLGLQLIGKRITPQVGDPSAEVDDRVAPLPSEMVLTKASSGPLNSTRLDQTLHNLGVNSLVVCGLTTAVCVSQTARETADRGFHVVIASDACTEMSEEMHEAALNAFGYVFGRVASSKDLVELYQSGLAVAA